MTITRRTSTPLLLAAVILLTAALAGAQTPAASPLDDILKKVATWNGGLESDAIWSLRDYVRAHRGDEAGRLECETKFLPFLKGTATPAAKVVVSRHLRTLAGDGAVPGLQALLADERTADYAIYVLQPLPGAAAERALVQSLKTAKGAVKTAVIGALGERRAAAAVPDLVALLAVPATAGPAATALGRIGGSQAALALEAAYAASTGPAKASLTPPLLAAADSLLTAKDAAGATRLFDLVLGATPAATAAQRRAAAGGKIAAAGTGASALVLEWLKKADPELLEAAVVAVPGTFPGAAIGTVVPLVASVPEGAQVQLLTAFSGYPIDRVSAAVEPALASQSAAVRLAALKTLGTIGDTRAVRPLAEIAVKARGAEQTAARTALGSLKGRPIDGEIVAQLSQKPADALAVELIGAVADRRIFIAKPAVVAALASPAAPVRQQALKTLRAIGTPSDLSAVVDRLVKCDDDGERGEAEKTVAALAQKMASPDGRARSIRMRLMAATGAEKARLLAVLPLIGDPSVLPQLRAALADTDPAVAEAAVRGLSEWPTAAVKDDLLAIVRTSTQETHKLLALTGFVRIVGLEPYRLPAAAVADLKTAGGLAWRAEERKLVLGALVPFASPDALELAKGWMNDPEVKAEAEAAIEKINTRLQERGPMGRARRQQ
jgi:HEAT repeat protein